MTVYVMHRQSTNSPAVFQLEAFPSRERAMSALQVRSRTQVSTAYPAHVPGGSAKPWPWKDHRFPEADPTGYMIVWLRAAADLPPAPTDTPDEIWRLSQRGAVRRLPWDDGTQRPQVDQVPYGQLSAQQRRTMALRYAQALPPVRPSFGEAVGLEFRRALYDLAQDAEAGNALLRLAQAARDL